MIGRQTLAIVLPYWATHSRQCDDGPKPWSDPCGTGPRLATRSKGGAACNHGRIADRVGERWLLFFPPSALGFAPRHATSGATRRADTKRPRRAPTFSAAAWRSRVELLQQAATSSIAACHPSREPADERAAPPVRRRSCHLIHGSFTGGLGGIVGPVVPVLAPLLTKCGHDASVDLNAARTGAASSNLQSGPITIINKHSFISYSLKSPWVLFSSACIRNRDLAWVTRNRGSSFCRRIAKSAVLQCAERTEPSAIPQRSTMSSSTRKHSTMQRMR